MKTTTARIAETYALLDRAKCDRMETAERVAFVRGMRPLRKIAEEFEQTRRDAVKRLRPEGFDKAEKLIADFNAMPAEERGVAVASAEMQAALKANAEYVAAVNDCIADEAEREVESPQGTVSEETFGRLMESNPEWTLGQAMLVRDLLCNQED